MHRQPAVMGAALDLLSTPLEEHLSAVKLLSQLKRFGISTLEELLTHYPRRYEDRRQFDRFPAGESEKPICVCGVVVKRTLKRLPGWKKLFEIVLQEQEAHALSPTLHCRWFNLHYVDKVIATGQRLVVYGKPKQRKNGIVIDHPEFEVLEDDAEVSIHLQRITPIYPATEGLSQRVLRRLIFELLGKLDLGSLARRLPEQLSSMPLGQALRDIHFPQDEAALERARRELVLAEFFAMQLLIGSKRAEFIELRGQSHCGNGELLERFHDRLPFPLTDAQRRVIGEIRGDLAATRPMNRLLHGDVGSGKTVVALSAMLLAVEAGFQTALMAPTQILAEQHYLNFRRWLEPLGVRVALRTANRKEESAPLPLFSNGEPAAASIIVGTHALLYESNDFSQLGLVVIDEQHKFGVLQRAKLIDQGNAPDVLVMTATPIPRTLTMTLYGDLDVSTLDQMPADRGRIVTALRDSSKLPEAAAFIRKHLEDGRQAYVVYPLIDQSEKLEAKAATQEFEKWRQLLAPMPCELLHGRVPPEEKEQIMGRFRSGATKALIATTVIEVGIDVPNANLMLIENAERFGLAQLHQLRGRIGRGSHKSYCILLSSEQNPQALEKLRTLEASSNGFDIAEADLRLRGPGDILGTAQSGLPPLKLGDLLADTELMQQARLAAQALLAHDPHLQRQENKDFRELLLNRKRMLLSQIS